MQDVDIALSALADPTRRRVIELLIESPRRTKELAEAIDVSVPAVSRHLRVLRERELVDRVDVDGDGRGRLYRLNPTRLATLAAWLGGEHWTDKLSGASTDPDVSVFLARVGGFLDAFAQSDAAFFERHLATDAQLVFAYSSARWDKAATMASVYEHAPYVEWDIAESSIRALSTDLTLVTVDVTVRTTAAAGATRIVQSMIFDDAGDPWTLRFLQQSPASRDRSAPHPDKDQT